MLTILVRCRAKIIVETNLLEHNITKDRVQSALIILKGGENVCSVFIYDVHSQLSGVVMYKPNVLSYQ